MPPCSEMLRKTKQQQLQNRQNENAGYCLCSSEVRKPEMQEQFSTNVHNERLARVYQLTAMMVEVVLMLCAMP